MHPKPRLPVAAFLLLTFYLFHIIFHPYRFPPPSFTYSAKHVPINVLNWISYVMYISYNRMKYKILWLLSLGILCIPIHINWAVDVGKITADVDEQGKLVYVTLRGHVPDYYLKLKNTTLADGNIYIIFGQEFEDGGESWGIPQRIKKWMVIPGSSTHFEWKLKYGPTSFAQTKHMIAGIMWCLWQGQYCERHLMLATCKFTYTIQRSTKHPTIAFCDDKYKPLPDYVDLHPYDPMYIKVWTDFSPVYKYTNVAIVGSYSPTDTLFITMKKHTNSEIRYYCESIKSLGQYGILNLASWAKLYAIVIYSGKVVAIDSLKIRPLWMK